MADKQYRPGDAETKHPEPVQSLLNPHAEAGQNSGLVGDHPEKHVPATAYDIKELHHRLKGYADDDLKQIPVLPEGSRLEQGASYIDLHAKEIREFVATANIEAGPENWFVPKRAVPGSTPDNRGEGGKFLKSTGPSGFSAGIGRQTTPGGRVADGPADPILPQPRLLRTGASRSGQHLDP